MGETPEGDPIRRRLTIGLILAIVALVVAAFANLAVNPGRLPGVKAGARQAYYRPGLSRPGRRSDVISPKTPNGPPTPRVAR
jgi:hypothetical protein